MRSTSIEESHNKSKFWNVPVICKPSQCQFLQLPVHSKLNKVWHLYALLGLLLITTYSITSYKPSMHSYHQINLVMCWALFYMKVWQACWNHKITVATGFHAFMPFRNTPASYTYHLENGSFNSHWYVFFINKATGFHRTKQLIFPLMKHRLLDWVTPMREMAFWHWHQMLLIYFGNGRMITLTWMAR